MTGLSFHGSWFFLTDIIWVGFLGFFSSFFITCLVLLQFYKCFHLFGVFFIRKKKGTSLLISLELDHVLPCKSRDTLFGRAQLLYFVRELEARWEVFAFM